MSGRKAKPATDDGLYTVVCAGVRIAGLSREQAMHKAESLNREWAELGYNGGRGRRADVFYRDGSLVASLPVEVQS